MLLPLQISDDPHLLPQRDQGHRVLHRATRDRTPEAQCTAEYRKRKPNIYSFSIGDSKAEDQQDEVHYEITNDYAQPTLPLISLGLFR